MKIKNTNTGGGGNDFDPIPEGLHQAVCVAVVGTGEQVTTYNDVEKIQEKVWITWEIPAERRKWTTKDEVEHEGPAMMSQEYTLTQDERSKLRKHLKGWRGKDFTIEEFASFDIETLLGVNCQIMVTHSTGKKDPSKVYANVNTLIAYKGEKFKAESDLVFYDPDEHTEESFSKVKVWQQKMVNLPDGTKPYKPEEASGDIGNNATAATGVVTEEENIPF